jgi:hypothetical protein
MPIILNCRDIRGKRISNFFFLFVLLFVGFVFVFFFFCFFFSHFSYVGVIYCGWISFIKLLKDFYADMMWNITSGLLA